MGYRSDVSIVFYTDNKSKTPFTAVKFWFDENYPKHDFCDVEVGDNYVLVTYEDVKWYDGYPEVEAVENAVALFCETFGANEDNGVHYERVRVGEETHDIVHDNSDWCHFLLYVERKIHFN